MRTHKDQSIDCVTLSYEDIPALIALSTSVGWDYDEHEIRTIIKSGKIYGYKREGKVVSSAAIIPYDASLASIGMVIVHEAYRGMGLGKIVTQMCIDTVSKDTTIMLIATEQGKPLYEKMGFSAVDCVQKYLCDRYIPIQSNDKMEMEIHTFSPKDLAQIVTLDERAVGAKRKKFLINRIEQAKECLTVKDRDGTVIGYGLSILGPVNLILGPIVAPNFEIACLLVDKLARNHQGRVRIDVPSGHEEFMLFLEQHDFYKASQSPVMIINSKQLPPRNGTLYGIAAQVFG
ncbi:GNAT family N-acetyltransferase [Anoxybacteroides rupiense]|uniref:GNAT family N-acetyltransferase n=1 Tax=Anoxybacteroides rupiense TaxID=311460 RepID=UPI0016067AB3|nr:GNAT family N-acetyltransferase [Anoxybacillus rupiensis]MBB3908157.1 putative GNAT family N-acyltransferase [Anoxybacillus rupiensis]